MVLSLPRQIRTSNGTVHHDVQLSLSTCCKTLSSSSLEPCAGLAAADLFVGAASATLLRSYFVANFR